MSKAEEKNFIKKDSFQLFFKTLIRVLIICLIFLGFYGSYLMAEETFSNPAYDVNGKKTVKIIVRDNDSEESVASQLKDKKLIYGTYRFRIRKYFSKYKDRMFLPGEYTFSQAQGMDDIMGILCGEHETEEIQP